ncbi:MAG TPA: class I SAM-dependent methyltransferase [Gammaproteobacteria bacterium]|nr:class I SAM-dependent methyltransferase [Gammaproteobacteria bacterium]
MRSDALTGIKSNAIIARCLALIRRARAENALRQSRGRSRAAIFRDIYAKGQWGKRGKEFFSGLGSIGTHVGPYVGYVSEFVRTNGIEAIVDLGCGDFRVASQIDLGRANYLGCDIVEELIARNTASFGNDKISFGSLDIVTDDLPDGDLCLVRQVFQHLSNGDILRSLVKLSAYRFVLITDELGPASARPNLDIEAFRGTRTDFGSGLYYDQPPFNLPVEVVLDTPIMSRKGYYLRTVLLRSER